MTEDRRAWSREIPPGPWDAVVIGSGMGGMTAAALLAKVGRRVLVLEQHLIPGGFTQTFKRPGYRWDVGVHLVGEMSERSFPGRLLHSLTDGRLEWAFLGDVYDEFNFPDGFTIRFPSSKDGFRETLIDAFPGERPAVDRYLALIRDAAGSASTFLRLRDVPAFLAPGQAGRARRASRPHLTATTADVLAEVTDDPRLRAVLAAQWGYYGSTPSRSSFAMHALMVAHFLHGAYYPVGTAASIARELLGSVSDAGGWTAVRTAVDGILVDGGSVRGVRLGDGREIEARTVISAVGAAATASLLNEPLDDPVVGPGPAHLSLYLGFEGDVEAVGASRYSQWFFESWDMEVDRWDVAPGQDPGSVPVLFNSFPSIKDPAHVAGDPPRHTGEAITFVPWEPFEPWIGSRWKKRGPDYDEFKAELTSAMMAEYERRYPRLAPMVRHAELSTPLSTHHFARSDRGSIYGLSTEPARFLDETLGARTPIRRLFRAGVDVMTPGVAGALGGGVVAAMAADPIRVARYLRPIMRRPAVVS